MGEDLLTLRALEPEDIDAVYLWENDPAVWEHSSVHRYFSRHQLTQYIMAAGSGDFYTDRQLRLIAEVDGRPVGCIDLFDYDPFQHRAELGMLVDSACRRKGYGKAMLAALEDYCRLHLQLHQIYCVIPSSHRSATALFLRQGYKEAGRMQDWVYDPLTRDYHEAVLLQKILS